MKLIAILISIIFCWGNTIGYLPSQGLPVHDTLRPQASGGPFANIDVSNAFAWAELTEYLKKLNENIILPLDIFSRIIYAEFYPAVCHTTALFTAKYISQKTEWRFYHNIMTLLKHEIGVACLPLDVNNGETTHLVTAVKYYDKVLLIDNISNWQDSNAEKNAYITMTKEQILKGQEASFGNVNYPTLFSLRNHKDEETIRRNHDKLVKLTEKEGLTEAHFTKDEWLFDSLIKWIESPTEKTAGDIVRRIIAIDDGEINIQHRLSVMQDLTKDGELVIDGDRRNVKQFLEDISVTDFLKKLPEDRLLKLILIVHRILIELSYGPSHREQIGRLRRYIDSEGLNLSAKYFFEYTEQKHRSMLEVTVYDKTLYERKIGDAVDDRMRNKIKDGYLVHILNAYSWIVFDRLKLAIFARDKEAEENLTRFLRLKHRINVWLYGRDPGFYRVSLKASEDISRSIERARQQARYLYEHYNIAEPAKASSASSEKDRLSHDWKDVIVDINATVVDENIEDAIPIDGAILFPAIGDLLHVGFFTDFDFSGKARKLSRFRSNHLIFNDIMFEIRNDKVYLPEFLTPGNKKCEILFSMMYKYDYFKGAKIRVIEHKRRNDIEWITYGIQLRNGETKKITFVAGDIMKFELRYLGLQSVAMIYATSMGEGNYLGCSPDFWLKMYDMLSRKGMIFGAYSSPLFTGEEPDKLRLFEKVEDRIYLKIDTHGSSSAGSGFINPNFNGRYNIITEISAAA